MTKKRILTGVKPTGAGMHIGNYLGMFKPLMKAIEGKRAFLFIPDFHSLTSVHNRETLESNKKRLLREIFSLLPEDSDINVFEQSKMSHINDISWILSSITPYSLMLRAHSFKDSQNKNSDINMAVFNYPILMAADILSYDIDIVPVGKDQKQHLEFARDIAENFNKTYNNNFFKLPEPLINDELAIIPGVDGRKMSKSYDNHIGIFDDEKTLKKKIMSITTGSEGLEEYKNPENCNVYALIKFFASENRLINIAHKYREGGYGYGHAKLELLDIILEYFKEPRKKYNSVRYNSNDTKFINYMNKNKELIDNTILFDDYINYKLKIGNKAAKKIQTEKYNKLKVTIGL